MKSQELWEKQITALCLRNLPELRKKIITLNSVLAFWPNRRLPGWAVGLSEWAGNLLPSIISPVPAKKAVFTFSNCQPFLASLCFGCPQLSQVCQVQDSKCSLPLLYLVCDDHPEVRPGSSGWVLGFSEGVRSCQTQRGSQEARRDSNWKLHPLSC